MHEWAVEVKNLLPSFRQKLQNDTVAHPGLLKALDEVETHFLFDGFQTFFENYLNRQKIVLAHNDTQENNFLVHKDDNRSLTLIDYEYTGWCTRATDLANFVNECAIDNAHPGGFGVKIYHENMMSDAERQSFLSEYLRLCHENAEGEARTWDAYLA